MTSPDLSAPKGHAAFGLSATRTSGRLCLAWTTLTYLWTKNQEARLITNEGTNRNAQIDFAIPISPWTIETPRTSQNGSHAHEFRLSLVDKTLVLAYDSRTGYRYPYYPAAALSFGVIIRMPTCGVVCPKGRAQMIRSERISVEPDI